MHALVYGLRLLILKFYVNCILIIISNENGTASYTNPFVLHAEYDNK
jgi:hypothetical protein